MPGSRDLVLVGGGHAHVQVLRRLAMAPIPGVRATLVVDRSEAVYSGMVPGFVAGDYAAHALTIDVRPLARRAGVAVVVAAATGVDAAGRRIELAGRPPLRFDVASLDVGSTVAGLERPGVAELALATRPIGRFVAEVEALLARARRRGRCRLVVVGGGAGGVELACAFRARLAREGVAEPVVTLLEAGPRLLAGLRERVARRAAAALAARGVAIRTDTRVAALVAEGEARRVCLEDGASLACDEVVWVTGAAPPPWLAATRLPTDAAGYVRVGATLAVPGVPGLFAVGDCAAFGDAGGGLAKAGVYAVRQGPLLDHNLRAALAGTALRRYRPQRDFLTLLNLGDGTALGTKWGLAVEGRWVLRAKDAIDRRFVRRFQVLGPDDARTPDFPAMPGEAEMPCGGCAAKLGAGPLAAALARLGAPHDDAVLLGLDAGDDVAAVRTPGGESLVASLDAFRAFTDDPWLVGRVAAVNAMSDLWAKGVAPRFALAQVTVPDTDAERAEETLYQVLAGARAAFDPEDVALVGGHTTSGPELAVGFAVWGTAAPHQPLLRLGGLAPGDRLLLTKPLGTGVLFAADMRGLARGAWIEAAVASMIRANAAAAQVARAAGASAATDVSGFGLAGHLAALLRASKASARIDLDALPLLPGAASCLARGLRSSLHVENARGRRGLRLAPAAAAHPALDVLFDPQTSGGLLFGVAPPRAGEALAALRAAGDADAAVIGEVRAPDAQAALFEVVARGAR